jgi:hypothetical protein
VPFQLIFPELNGEIASGNDGRARRESCQN